MNFNALITSITTTVRVLQTEAISATIGGRNELGTFYKSIKINKTLSFY
ncbi:hypothetical protein HNP25_000693 [Arcicella rosea]|uniref:Uncharacterized protein n=1 Tax=Arcicella rosea TaxID=502909 RepID=A0A841EII9_9BACT|nr:hypothetical protein [Arcicella rosea]